MIEAEGDEGGDRQNDSQNLAGDVAGGEGQPHTEAHQPVAAHRPQEHLVVAFGDSLADGDSGEAGVVRRGGGTRLGRDVPMTPVL